MSATHAPESSGQPALVLTVDEATAVLRVGRDKIYDLIRSGALPSYTEGRARRIPVESARAYVQNKLKESA
ncbi:helix-turn-helix domain-containing protein [Streptomyces sp. NPDC021218]|uniref:helix-turn-helix domain-containing protein n=1 Tax=Streptomyces sp. NPDC021218 TaxID=3365119 RepID=UPI003792CD31